MPLLKWEFCGEHGMTWFLSSFAQSLPHNEWLKNACWYNHIIFFFTVCEYQLIEQIYAKSWGCEGQSVKFGGQTKLWFELMATSEAFRSRWRESTWVLKVAVGLAFPRPAAISPYYMKCFRAVWNVTHFLLGLSGQEAESGCFWDQHGRNAPEGSAPRPRLRILGG